MGPGVGGILPGGVAGDAVVGGAQAAAGEGEVAVVRDDVEFAEALAIEVGGLLGIGLQGEVAHEIDDEGEVGIVRGEVHGGIIDGKGKVEI